MKRNILLGITGSVAATLAPKLVEALQQLGEVRIVTTKNGEYFLTKCLGAEIISDIDEWSTNTLVGGPRTWNKKGDSILHIELRKWASALVIAPLSANTLAKIRYGLCDNLLTNVVRAWDTTRPIIAAPAMNTFMWENDLTNEHINELDSRGVKIVAPQEKTLACNDHGNGAMADIDNIVEATRDALRWSWPFLTEYFYLNSTHYGIPVGNHPGAFGARRKHSHHTGVDLYWADGATVLAMESGRVVGREPFTGPQDGSPWWNDTDALLIEGASGVICYGEIEVLKKMVPGTVVQRGNVIGKLRRVLKENKARPDLPGHSTSMLHIELYKHGQYKASTSWKLDASQWDYMFDPTPFLKEAKGAPSRTFDIEKALY